MTATQALQVGHRLLGIYLLVTGVSTGVGALAIFGFYVPAGDSRALMIVVSVLQAAVSVAAGVILMRRPAAPDQDHVPQVSAPETLVSVLPSLLQLLGVYFVVVGLESLARPALNLLWIGGKEWQIVSAEIGASLILLVAGVRLVAYPSHISDLLSKRRSAAAGATIR